MLASQEADAAVFRGITTMSASADQFKRLKKRGIANAKLLAHLFLRRMVATHEVMRVVFMMLHRDPRRPTARAPPAYKIDCVLALWLECGHALEHAEETRRRYGVYDNWMGIQSRLKCLRRTRKCLREKDADGKPILLPKQTRAAIANLLDLRKKRWRRKVARRGDAGDVIYIEQVVGARVGVP